MKKHPGSALCGTTIALVSLAILAAVGETATPASSSLTLNDRDYFEKPGLNVLVFSSEYNGFFFDEKTAGIELIHHGVRTATGGAVRLKPTPEQWDQIPRVASRKVDREKGTIEVVLRYDDFAFDSRLVVRPEADGFSITVFLDQPLPERLEGRTGLNLEFLPSAYFEKTYLIDGRPCIFPLYPSGPIKVRPADTQIRQYAGHSTFDDRGRKEYVEAEPIAAGHTLVLAPEDPERHVTITSASGELMLLDGRNVAQNGWYVVRTPLPAKATGKVAEWLVRPHTIQDWKRAPVIGFSQAGYHPSDRKVAVIELDASDTPLPTASLFEVTAAGATVERLKGKVEPWGAYLRYRYATFDFSAIQSDGLFFVQYGNRRTQTFPISPKVYEDIWYKTLDVWFPVQMDHMFVNEAYRVWHGTAHMDDARQAPVNHQHFDGYRMVGQSTETSYAPGEHIPGLNVGGWFDAGDFDIRTGSHSDTVMNMVDTWELFRPMRDETLVDQTGRYVDIHHPDGKPDLLQQIEHGALQLAAQHRAFGRGIPGIIEPQLHQYHHLGDASTQTDGLVYDAELAPGQREGERSGTPDDRWAFTNKTPAANLASVAALAAASRALRGFNDALAEECLKSAKKAWDDEQQQRANTADEPPFTVLFRERSELVAALQLLITTKEKTYADRFDALLWPALERVPPPGVEAVPHRTIGVAVRALPYLDSAYAAKLLPYVRKYKDWMEELAKKNPYGVPIGRRGWAGNEEVIAWAVANYRLHKAYPDLFDRDSVLRGLRYVLGCHPASNVSFVSGVGTHSKRIAYGNNRADFTFIAGGVTPGVLVLKPDFPENKEDWPFLWGENEYVIDICADYILLAHMANDLVAASRP
jgi:endoglucanase